MRLHSIAFFLATSAAAGSALALTQPDGTPIPQNPANNGLQNLFTSRGESIDALADAAITPQTFVPACALTFTVLQRNAGYQNAFGWYNITGQKPGPADLHEFLNCNDKVGTVKMLDIKNDPAYLGGEIGFYEGVADCAANGNYQYVFYSEPKYNPDSGQANAFIHLLIYNSTVTEKAFYFGWEDLIQGGDNDFDDLTTFVTGITCSGGGGPCETGQPGICGDGTMQCQSGKLTCVQANQPTMEKCDGLDNDCNGLDDDGDLCPTDEVCDKGSCVPECGGGEFSCPPTQVCADNGLCVDAACMNVTCPSGKKCQEGQCVGPCDGVVCPNGQVCRVGACVDPCASISCDSGQVCVAGVCTDNCACAGCPAGQQCQPDGRCVLDACVGKTCNAGEYCDASGACQDACSGAVCPSGQVCMAGQCVPGPASGSGGSGEGGSIFVGSGGSGGAGGAGGGGGMGGAGTGANGNGGAGDSGSCGCRLADASPAGVGGLVALAAAAAVARRRRKPGAR